MTKKPHPIFDFPFHYIFSAKIHIFENWIIGQELDLQNSVKRDFLSFEDDDFFFWQKVEEWNNVCTD